MSETPRTPPPSLTVCPDGPYLLRGDVRLVDGDGKEIPRRPGTIALCRCGRSSRAPFCDGTHKLAARGARAREGDAG